MHNSLQIQKVLIHQTKRTKNRCLILPKSEGMTRAADVPRRKDNPIRWRKERYHPVDGTQDEPSADSIPNASVDTIGTVSGTQSLSSLVEKLQGRTSRNFSFFWAHVFGVAPQGFT